MLSQEGGPDEVEEAKQFAEASLKLCNHSQKRHTGDKHLAQRFDSTMAEATQLLGTVCLKSGELQQACDHLLQALTLTVLSEGTTSLRIADILEDLAFAHTRKRFDPSSIPGAVSAEELSAKANNPTPATGKALNGAPPLREATCTLGESLFAVMVPTVQAVGTIDDPLRKILKDRQSNIDDEDAIDAMMLCALEIRRRKNGPTHVRVAHALVRRAELFWTQRRYAQVCDLYARAIEIFADDGGVCKAVCQLTSWSAIAYLLNGDLKMAEHANKKAEDLSIQVFGAVSWESFRLMIDKVRIYMAMVEECNVPSTTNPSPIDEYKGQADRDKSADPSRRKKAQTLYAKAERCETQAAILQASLVKDKVLDLVLPTLSYFAPIYRGGFAPARVDRSRRSSNSKRMLEQAKQTTLPVTKAELSPVVRTSASPGPLAAVPKRTSKRE